MTTALFIGRFQPFHRGHHHVVKEMKKQFKPVVGIGSSEQMNTERNPLSFSERRKIIKNCFPGIHVIPVPDVPSDKKWVTQILDQVHIATVISGNDWTRDCFDGTGVTVTEPDYLRRDMYEGTQIRELAAKNDNGWKKCVPSCSLELLERFNFAERMQQIAEDGN